MLVATVAAFVVIVGWLVLIEMRMKEKVRELHDKTDVLLKTIMLTDAGLKATDEQRRRIDEVINNNLSVTDKSLSDRIDKMALTLLNQFEATKQIISANEIVVDCLVDHLDIYHSDKKGLRLKSWRTLPQFEALKDESNGNGKEDVDVSQ